MNNPSSANNPQSEPLNRHEARQMRREGRHAARGGVSWVAGLILVVLGAAFLLQNTGNFVFPFDNWWALFIMIPAVGAFGNAWSQYQKAGHWDASARGSVLGGLILTFITCIFLFNLSWTYLGPILIILAGIGILVNFALPGKE
jgi:hypothetical protein